MVYGGNNTKIIILANTALILSLIIFMIIYIKKLRTIPLICYLLIISGGLGNLIDRVFRGYVIDYIDINRIINYPIFNLADIYIVIGAISFIIYSTIQLKQEKKLNEKNSNRKNIK